MMSFYQRRKWTGNKWGVPLLIGSAIALSSCHKERVFDVLADEFSKHDPWISQSLEEHVKVMIVRKEDMSLGDRIGIIETCGQFDIKTDVLYLPKEGSFSKETIDGIDHELGHVITDTLGIKGLMFRQGYKGPSLDDVAREMDAVYGRAEFDSLRTLYREDAVIVENRQLLETIKTLLTATEEYQGFIAEMDEYQKENARFKSLVDKKRLQRQRKSIEHGMEEVEGSFAGLSLPDSTTVRYKYNRRVLQLQVEELKGKTSVFEGIDSYCDSVFFAYGQAQRQYFTERIERLEKKIEEEDNWEPYLAALEGLEREYADVQDAQEGWIVWNSVKKKVTSFSMRLSHFNHEVKYTDGIDAGAGVMVEPLEIFARMIDSLYSLHYGPPTHIKFPLRESDLQFLGMFTYDGVQVFRKGIERYELGLRMRSDGVSEEEVAKLEHAETWNYGGMTYSWPKTEVTLHFIE